MLASLTGVDEVELFSSLLPSYGTGDKGSTIHNLSISARMGFRAGFVFSAVAFLYGEMGQGAVTFSRLTEISSDA